MPEPDRTLTRPTVERVLAVVDGDWRLQSVEPIATGTAAVARVVVATGDGERDCVLKASPDGDRHGIDTEARLLALLSARTGVPVPEPLAAVDAGAGADPDLDADLPTPLLLTAHVPGESVARTALHDLDGAVAERVARAMGRHLAAVHRIEAVEAFGYLEPAGRGLAGERPPADPASVRVVDPEPEWRAAMRAYTDRELDVLAEGRLADLHDPVERALHGRIDGLAGPFEPVLAHVDGLLENVRIDRSGDLLGMLDWGFTVAATPAYDLVHVAGGLGGGVWTLADPPSWVDRAREALIEGYADRAPGRVERYRRNRSCYELLRLARMAAHLEEWLALKDLDDPARVAATERALRARIGEVIES